MEQDTAKTVLNNFSEINPNFYQTGEFWVNFILTAIGIILGAFSVYYSIRSFREAAQAKTAAQGAAKTVRKQDIIVVLTELLNECQVIEELDYYDATNRYQTLYRKLNHVTGLYSGDMSIIEKEILTSIKDNLSAIKETLGLFNKAITPNNDDIPEEFLHLQISPLMIELSGNIELLKGTLQDSLIK